MFEWLYPVAAVAYGSFGICFGVYLWWRTQLRVERTGGRISTQVKNAVTDINQRIDEKLEMMEARIDAKIAEIPDAEDIEFPQPDYEAIAQLVGKHVEMQFRQVEAQQAKRTGEFLKSMGVDEALQGMEEGMREEALAAAGPQAQAMFEVLNAKIPKKASLIEKTIMQFAKAQAAQMLQGQMPGAAAVEQAPQPTSRGFGVR